MTLLSIKGYIFKVRKKGYGDDGIDYEAGMLR